MLLISFTLVLLLALIHGDVYRPETPKSNPLPETLSELLSSVEPDGIIYGNPLLYPECANALVSNHDMYSLSSESLVLPWFWSRETISALQHNRPLHKRTKIQSANDPTAIYPIITSQQLTHVADKHLLADRVYK